MESLPISTAPSLKVQPVVLHSSKLFSIQYLRAFAALSVALYHTLNIFEFITEANIPAKPSLAAGVDVFFVISGFIMCHSAMATNRAWQEFVWNRLFRIVPLYWIFTAAFVPVMFTSEHLKLGFSVRKLVMSVLFIPYEGWPILGVGWSLNYEMFFYAILAVAMIMRKNIVIFGCISIGLLCVSGLFVTRQSPSQILFYTRSIMIEFLIGMILSQLFQHVARFGKLPGILFSIFGATLIIISGCFSELAWSNLQFIMFGIPAAMIVTGFLAMEAANTQFNNRFLLLLGNASYSIYLTHGFPLLAMAFIVKRSWWPHGVFGGLIFVVATMAIIPLVGILTHKWIENPILRFFRRIAPVGDHRAPIISQPQCRGS